MPRVDTPWDDGADSCTRRSAQMLGIFGLMVFALVRGARRFRKARRRG